MRPLLLLVEDDPAIAGTVVYALQRDGFDVDHVLLLRDARERLARRPPQHALVILDIGLPDGCGLDLCRELRRGDHRSDFGKNANANANAGNGDNATDSTIPILMLSARGEELDRVLGLELGADDYLVKPFSPRELAARIRALLRRAAAPAPAPAAAPTSIEAPAPWLHCDRDGARIRVGSVWLKLTRREFGLLEVLMRTPGKVWSRDALLAAVWGDSADSIDRTVDTHIKTLRAKLRDVQPDHELIVTHRGLGYSLDVSGPAPSAVANRTAAATRAPT
jgi:two-component system, OmpR family, catabolic regulation response regulator CreB